MRWDRNYQNPEPINDPVIIPAYGVTDEERAYWNAKQEALEYDRYPTLRSDKHCTSGVIHRALEDYKVQAIELSQAFFWGHTEGLAQAIERCENAAEDAARSKQAAEDAQADALISKGAAEASKNAAAISEGNAAVSKSNADVAATNALSSSYDAEAWATGKRNGEDVPASDPTYHNNAKYYAALGSEIIQDNEVSLYTTWSSNKINAEFEDKADLVDGKVPAAQLPSFVDDVEEYSDTSAFPVTGEAGKLYVALDTNRTYRWSGSIYVEVSESLALGETSSTAYAGNKGKANADAIADMQALIPSNATTSNKLSTMNDIPTALSAFTDDASHRLVTDAEKAGWDSKANGSHTHDDRYYTETEIDAKFNGVSFTTENGVDYINW